MPVLSFLLQFDGPPGLSETRKVSGDADMSCERMVADSRSFHMFLVTDSAPRISSKLKKRSRKVWTYWCVQNSIEWILFESKLRVVFEVISGPLQICLTLAFQEKVWDDIEALVRKRFVDSEKRRLAEPPVQVILPSMPGWVEWPKACKASPGSAISFSGRGLDQDC